MTTQPSQDDSNTVTTLPTRDFIVTVKKRGEADRDFPVEAIDEGDAVRQAYQAAGVAMRTESYYAVATRV